VEDAVALMRAHIAERRDRIMDLVREGYAELYTGNALAAQLVGAEA
jgi:hypothetical protein